MAELEFNQPGNFRIINFCKIVQISWGISPRNLKDGGKIPCLSKTRSCVYLKKTFGPLGSGPLISAVVKEDGYF